ENVNLLHIQSGNAWGPAEVKAKFGVRPDQMRDYLALVGDGSDNIKGVPKIGAVNAARLLKEFGTCHGIIEALDETGGDGEPKVNPPAIRKALIDSENMGQLDLAIRLVTLRTDAPIDCDAIFVGLASEGHETPAAQPEAPRPPQTPPSQPKPQASTTAPAARS